MAPTNRPRGGPDDIALSMVSGPGAPGRDAGDAVPSSEASGSSFAPSAPGSTPPMSGFLAAALRELSPYLSEVNSLALLTACAGYLGVRRDQLGPSHLPEILKRVRATLDFFGLPAERRDKCLAKLGSLTDAEPAGARDDSMTIPVEAEQDIVRARLAGKTICQRLGFTEIGSTKVMTAISELARNIIKYAARGSIHISRLSDQVGVQVTARDQGPGIADVNKVLSPSFRSQSGMGRGLRGTRALMDYFDIQSRPGEGTVVIVRKLRS